MSLSPPCAQSLLGQDRLLSIMTLADGASRVTERPGRRGNDADEDVNRRTPRNGHCKEHINKENETNAVGSQPTNLLSVHSRIIIPLPLPPSKAAATTLSLIALLSSSTS